MKSSLPAAIVLVILGSLAVQAETPSGPLSQAVILTPPAPEKPRINGPKIFGVRPESPFLYSIPATGKRPMTFGTDGLPEGLKLDPATGRITGKLMEPGERTVVLRARNAAGSDEKPFRIVVGEEIALTPPMGWNSWNCWAAALDQEKAIRAAKAMVAAGLDQHGWTYINLDDTWQGERGGAVNAIQPNKKFPDIKALVDEIHGLGLKAGIYSTPWTLSYGNGTGGSSTSPEGKADPGADLRAKKNKHQLPFDVGPYLFIKEDVRQWVRWGFDYLKYDWAPVDEKNTREMADALRTCGRDIVYSISNNHEGNIFGIIGGIAPHANAWRTSGDIEDNWAKIVRIGFHKFQDNWAPYQKPGHYNDVDMLVVGKVGWGKLHPSKLTPDEQYSHVSLWCLLSSPLLIGCDMDQLDAFTLGLLTNDEVLAIDQDTLCKQAVRVTQANGEKLEVYAKPLDDGTVAVGLFNLRDDGPAKIAVQWSDLKISGKQTVRDLWRQKDIGVFEGQFEATVAPHGVVLLRMIPKK